MRTPHPPDRLFLLSTMRLALRFHRLTTPEMVLATTGQQRAAIGDHAAAIVKIVRTGDPDTMRALFLPAEPLSWGVAALAEDPFARLLSVGRTARGYTVERLVSHRYRVDDDGSEERAAWVQLRDTLRGVPPSVARE